MFKVLRRRNRTITVPPILMHPIMASLAKNYTIVGRLQPCMVLVLNGPGLVGYHMMCMLYSVLKRGAAASTLTKLAKASLLLCCKIEIKWSSHRFPPSDDVKRTRSCTARRRRLANHRSNEFALPLQLLCNPLKLFQGGLQIVGDLLGQHVRSRQIIGIFQALVFEPEYVEVHFVTLG
jgi:hypothetical protein